MLTIGEFSKLGHVSARMLRYYDAMGLLRPAHIGRENGYRYYGEEQLPRLARILRLREFGFPLAEIGPLLALDEPELARYLHHRRLEAHRELEALRASLRRMEHELVQMEGISMLSDKYHIIILEDPEQKVFCLHRTIPISETHALFEELHRAAEGAGLRRTGFTQLICHNETFDYSSMDVEAQMVVEGDAPGVKALPARTCAAVRHTGPYEDVKYAYEALCAWLAEHPEYRVCGPAVERYLTDESEAATPMDLETGVLFPVERC